MNFILCLTHIVSLTKASISKEVMSALMKVSTFFLLDNSKGTGHPLQSIRRGMFSWPESWLS